MSLDILHLKILKVFMTLMHLCVSPYSSANSKIALNAIELVVDYSYYCKFMNIF